MPNTCSVPRSRSNYKGEAVFSIHTTPDLANNWLRAICRECISVLNSVYVCIKHFREEDILRTFELHQADGSIQHIAR